MQTQVVKKAGSLRKRWILNTVGVVLSLGIVCVLAITASYAAYYYSNMQSDLENRAKTTTEFFADYMDQDYNEFYQSCIAYTQGYEKRNTIELQFIDRRGNIIASSYGLWAVEPPKTEEIQVAIDTRDAEPFVGKDPITGERIIAVSCPVIYSNGEVMGVLRYVTSTYIVDMQIWLVALVCIAVLVVVLMVVLFSSSYYIRSIRCDR